MYKAHEIDINEMIALKKVCTDSELFNELVILRAKKKKKKKYIYIKHNSTDRIKVLLHVVLQDSKF